MAQHILKPSFLLYSILLYILLLISMKLNAFEIGRFLRSLTNEIPVPVACTLYYSL